MSVLVLREAELRACVGIDRRALEAVAAAFGWLHEGRAVVPPVAHLAAEDRHGEVDIKTAYVRGLACFAVKIASGFPGNIARGLPAGSGMMGVFSTETGYCRAVLLDNGYLTDLRTGLAGAVAARHLAPAGVSTVGILGTGVQARYQLLCLRLVCGFERVLVWGRSAERLAAYLEEMRSRHGIAVEAAPSVEALVRESDLIVTVTASRSPLVRADWLRPGQHLTAVGADFPGKQELDVGVLERADRLYCDSLVQCRRIGELQHLADIDGRGIIELGAVVRGIAPPRQSRQQITICDLTGVGVQDTAIADLACAAAERCGAGTLID